MFSRGNRRVIFFLLVGSLVLAACGGASPNQSSGSTNDLADGTDLAPTAEPTAEQSAESVPTDVIPDIPAGAQTEFSTDFSKSSIPLADILSGGPRKDGIPAIDDPKFVSVSEADEWIDDSEPVIALERGDQARIYPIQILMWHEIVNDVIDGEPISVTFCPLCNTGIVFDATVDGRALDFGTTGRLRFSNLLMYDRQTETWWQQASGEAVIGDLVGSQLEFLPASFISWQEASETYLQAEVLSRETGYDRNYGRNPYSGYDDISRSPFLYDGPATPGELPPMARVTTVDLNDEAVAYPNEILMEEKVVNDTVGGVEIAVFWQPGQASALDANSIAEGVDVGASGVFERSINGQTLTFADENGLIRDDQTNSTWNILGEATEGELAGEQLEPVVKVDHFWFSWAAFRPETRVYQP